EASVTSAATCASNGPPNNRIRRDATAVPRPLSRRMLIISMESRIVPKSRQIGSIAMNAVELENRYGAHNYAPLPVVLARGEGAHLWDTSGRRYVDMMSAYSTASHGHAHPRILAALETQVRRLAVPSRAYYNDRLGPLLAGLCRPAGVA